MKPSDLAPRPWATAALATLLLGASGCLYETTSVVKIPALQTAYPVSASPHYVDARGDVVRDTDYEVVERFELAKTVKSPRHDASETPLRLEPELDSIVKRAHGDAVTRLTIDAASYDPGSHDAAALSKIMGWTFTPLGAAFVGVGIGLAQSGDPHTHPPIFYGMGGGMLGVGVLCFVIGAVSRTPAEWRYRVSGQVVRRAPEAPPPLPSAPE